MSPSKPPTPIARQGTDPKAVAELRRAAERAAHEAERAAQIAEHISSESPIPAGEEVTPTDTPVPIPAPRQELGEGTRVSLTLKVVLAVVGGVVCTVAGAAGGVFASGKAWGQTAEKVAQVERAQGEARTSAEKAHGELKDADKGLRADAGALEARVRAVETDMAAVKTAAQATDDRTKRIETMVQQLLLRKP